MNKFRKAIATPVLILIIFMAYYMHAQDSVNKEVWKTELQILLGFRGEDVDGIMGIETFNALKRFAYHHDLEDVVLRGEFGDLDFWGFEQYLIKYHPYWIREIKNQQIIDDVKNKEYIRQAEETIYSFDIAIQNAKKEAERLEGAKTKAARLEKEKQESDNWKIEKKEAERLTIELQHAILEAEAEAEKWFLEKLRAQRLASEKEQLEILNSRKAEATRLTYELEDIITSAKDEIDRLVEGNQKMKILIENSEKTETMAEELITKLSVTKNELKEAQDQIQDLSDRNDTLDIKLQDAKIEIENMLKETHKPFVRFWKKKMYENVGVSLHMGYRKDADTETNIDTLKVNILNDNKIPWWKFWKKKQEKSIDRKKQEDNK